MATDRQCQAVKRYPSRIHNCLWTGGPWGGVAPDGRRCGFGLEVCGAGTTWDSRCSKPTRTGAFCAHHEWLDKYIEAIAWRENTDGD